MRATTSPIEVGAVVFEDDTGAVRAFLCNLDDEARTCTIEFRGSTKRRNVPAGGAPRGRPGRATLRPGGAAQTGRPTGCRGAGRPRIAAHGSTRQSRRRASPSPASSCSWPSRSAIRWATTSSARPPSAAPPSWRRRWPRPSADTSGPDEANWRHNQIVSVATDPAFPHPRVTPEPPPPPPTPPPYKPTAEPTPEPSPTE